jgi:ABC-type glycerol-3-phosphate transport system substrate-binding protein
VLVLHDEQPLIHRPTPEQIQAFRERYRPVYLANSDAELAKFLPRTLTTTTAREPILEEMLVYLHQRRLRHLPELTIHVEFVSWQGAFRVFDDLLRHNMTSPDLLTMPTTWCTHFIKERRLAPLESLLQAQQTPLTQLYAEEVLKPCREPGSERVYGLPGLVDTRLLYVWKSIQHPIAGTIERVVDDPHAMAQSAVAFRDALQSLPGKFNARIRAMNHDIHTYNATHADRPLALLPEIRKAFVLPNAPQDWAKLQNFAMFVWLFGGELFTPKWGLWHQARFNLPAVVDYLLTIAPYTDIVEIQMPQAEQRFLERQYLVHIGVPTTLARAREELGEAWDQLIEIIPFPLGGEGKRATFLGGTHWAISQQATHRGMQEVAWDLLQFLTLQTEAHIRYAQGIGYLPATREALHVLQSRQPEYTAFASALATDGKSFPRLAPWSYLVENEFTLDQLTQFFRYVGFGREDGARMTLDRAAAWLTDELFWSPVRRLGVWIGIAMLLVVLSILSAKSWTERQHRMRLLGTLRSVELALQRAQMERDALRQSAHLTTLVLEGAATADVPGFGAALTHLHGEIGRTESRIAELEATQYELQQRLGISLN